MMDERITLSTLVSRLSINTGDSKKNSEDFIRELFALISEALERGESVKVRGLGVFKITNVEARKSVNVNDGSEHIIAAHGKVTFIPCKEIAALVNEPFEMFRTVELTEEAAKRLESELLPEDDQDVIIEEGETDGVAEASDDPKEISENDSDMTLSESSEDNLYMVLEEPEEQSKEDEKDYPRIFDFEVDEKVPEEKEPIIVPQEPAEAEIQDDNEGIGTENAESEERAENEEYDVEPDFAVHKARNYYWFGVVTGVVVTLIGGLLFWNFYGMKIDRKPSQRIEITTESLEKITTAKDKDSIENNKILNRISDSSMASGEDVPTLPSDALEYDTISKTRYLTTMAKDHYGNYNLWPYIYIENEKFLGHPDRIKPGTKVVVPSLSKYGVNPNDPVEIEKAKKLGVEIYSRYQ